MQEIFIEVGFDSAKNFARHFAHDEKKGVKTRKKPLNIFRMVTVGFF